MGLFSRKKDTAVEPSTPTPATEPPPATASFPVGIKVWVECEDATVDICFVHGLTGDRDHTWTFKGQAEPWPKTLIPEALAEVAKRRGVQKTPRARILTYGYDAYVVKTEVSSKNGLRDHAKHFLDQIVGDREMSDAVGRPLILVAHSLGGLVSKKAILISRNNPQPHLEDLYKSVKGIAFMGVPHRGSWMANWATFPISAFGIVKSTNTTILKILKTDDPLLQDTQKEFWSMIRKEREGGRNLGVTCFFEELPLAVVGKRVVNQESATLEGYDEVCIHANHSDMVKFDSKEHDGFKSLFGALVRWGTRSVDLSQVSGTA
ncbi:hypothetical protein CDV31_004498 [Fusarium ambrosium]|uniref:DUF676 domain-containing protein n=1 Tax=Fusarium ambrosium TaxID=131363 RepID=A0A428UR23_9HYPO|nr:hypothetical protein CDV31_004498 [Fusarium ambrosium]